MSAAEAQPTLDYEATRPNPSGMPVAGTDHEKEALNNSVSLEKGSDKAAVNVDVQSFHGDSTHLPDIPEADGFGRHPTEEEQRTLRMVPAAMPWAAVCMCFIEFAERASYYGCVGVFSNFIQRPLPEGGNGAGAVAPGEAGDTQSAGALGMGLQTATALTTLFTFLAYTVPIFGGIVADTKWGRFKTICVGTAVGAVAHVLLIIPAIPSVIAGGHAIAPFIISILILAFAAGFIKPSLGPLLCDQSPVKRQSIKELPSGELVIVDPGVTIQRYLMLFYWAINIGAFFSLATTYAEHDIGFWLAFLLPGIVYMLMPVILIIVAKRLYKAPPQGSVVVECFNVFRETLHNGGWKNSFKGGDDFWNKAKPSVSGRSVPWDDTFVDELRQSIVACKVFLLIPIFSIADGGFGAVQTNQAASMITNGVPNDLIGNFNPLTICIFAPILNFGIYPLLRKRGINLKPTVRMSIGFFLAALAMAIGAIIQWKVYETSPCGYYATECAEGLSNISLWWQIPLYSLPAIGELFVNVTSYEIAYTRAPARMKGLVYALVLFTSALSSALLEIVNPWLIDPNLIWPFVASSVSCILAIFALLIWFRNIDEEVVVDVDRMMGITGSHSTIETSDDAEKSLKN